MKIKRLAILLTVCGLLLTACGSSAKGPELKKYSAVRMDMFDTAIFLTGYSESEETFNRTADALFDELYQLHQLYDVYNEYDGIVNICTINRNAGGEALEVDERIIDLLQLAGEFAEATGGRVDATSGSVLRLWHDARSESLDDPDQARIPDADALARAAEHVGFDKAEIDPEGKKVRLTDPESLLDVGALAKGFAVQLVSADLPDGWLISAGGNVYASGEKPDGSGWVVGIQDPDGDASDILRKVSIARGAVVTSGDYQRYYTVDGVRYHHIIDLETLKPANRWRSVSIVCGDSGIADGLSTALFVMSREDGEKLLEKYGAAALWVGKDGSIEISRNMQPYLID